MKFGVDKKVRKWKWNRIVNTDFSGKFTLLPSQNKRNDGIWAEEDEVVPSVLINALTDKFRKGIIFWGGISSYGLIPAHAPINFTDWLHQQPTEKEKKYLTGDLYAKFVIEKRHQQSNKCLERLVLYQSSRMIRIASIERNGSCDGHYQFLI